MRVLEWSLALCLAKCAAQDQARDDSSRYHPREILLSLYQATGGFEWTDSSNWFQQGTDVCNWAGVECYPDDFSDARRRGEIRKIDLRNNHLVGTIPSIVFHMPYLSGLFVQENENVDVDLSEIGEAQYLTELDLSKTGVSSLTHIGGAKFLEVLRITDLGLTGELPQELFELDSLLALFANFNKFTGTIPSNIAKLTYLDEIYLFDNDLSGQIPPEIGLLTGLEVISMGQNRFGGTLPTEMNLLTNLQDLSIHRAEGLEKGPGISGKIPPFDNHKKLAVLHLENQRFNGELSSDFLLNCPAGETVEVDLTGNELSGAVPGSLRDKNFLSIYLADNKIESVPSNLYDSVSNVCPDIGDWMGGDVGRVGCNSLLCPPASWAPEGRATQDDQCQFCADDSRYWGRTSCASSTSSTVQERQTLVNFFNVMGGRSWKQDNGWLSLDDEVCDWYGIDCTQDGRINSIILRNNGLSGTPPSDLFSLPELRVLNFQSNSISFDFNGISRATKLEILDISNTDLPSVDDIEELSSIQSLRFLSLASNNIGGNIPQDLYGLANLEELNIAHNAFTGKLDRQVGNLVSLQRFSCEGNSLTGQLPTEIGSLGNLLELSAGENMFGGTLPTELDSLTNLQSLSLQQVIASGGIGGPMLSFSNLGQLTSLRLDSNALTGNLPSDLLVNSRNLASRIVVGLSENQLRGSIPSQWSRFDKFFLDLSGNRITEIPTTLCDLGDWMDGDVGAFGCEAILCDKDKFNEVGRRSDGNSECRDCSRGTGGFLGARVCGGSNNADDDSTLGILAEFFVGAGGLGWKNSNGWSDSTDYCNHFGVTCDGGNRVTKIELTDNGLGGSVPSAIFKLPQLRELILSKNPLKVSFDEISNAESLVSLYLDDTGLDSVSGIGAAPSLVTLHLEDNDLKGEIPRDLYSLTKLREIDLGFNQLSGVIPNIIGAWTSLESLHLYHNKFNGRIPAALGDLTLLRELNLAQNNFDGTIPLEFNDLTNLRLLSLQREGGINGSNDIGVNQGKSSALGAGLTGSLPAFNKLTSISELYIGVNSLSGSIPYNFLDGVEAKGEDIKIDLTSNILTGTVPASLIQFDRMSLFVAGNRITDIADGLCSKLNWMSGDVGTYGCDGILCPRDSYNALGRKGAGSTTCEFCSSGTKGVLGSFDCLSAEDHSQNSERAILEKIYQDLNGPNWLDNSNWLDRDESVCTWNGIECVSSDEESVFSISLGNNGLRGQVPSEIFSLPNLKALVLQGNDITLNFASIGSAQRLEYLDLDETSISSVAGIGSASLLKVLRIGGGNLASFPNEVFNLNNLEVLALSDNEFPEQEMPLRIQDFTNLVYFACSNCGFKGTIPTWIGSLANLEYLRLDQNAFSGSIPVEMFQLLNLKHLDLHDQASNGRGLSGNLPDFALQTQLTELFLQHNGFTGPIPATLLQGSKNDELITLDLRNNALDGAVPTELGRLIDLNLYLSANLITDLPTELCSKPWNNGNTARYQCDAIICAAGSFNAYGRAFGDLGCFPCEDAFFADILGNDICGTGVEHTALIFLYRQTGGPNWKRDSNWLRASDHCTWEGVTCHEDGDFKGLVQQLKLDDNNLVGSLPWAQLWMLEGLEYLNFEKNDVSIPFSLMANALSLETLILSETKTSSLDGIGDAPALKSLHITNAELKGQLPDELFQLTGLEELFLSHNALTGSLPTLIGNFKQLQALYMFDNNFNGKLPTELGFLVRIQHLSLGDNAFTGAIPRQMTSLPVLEFLSLQNEQKSDNFSVGTGLTGKLPALDGMPRMSQLYLGHNSFTGTIPGHFLNGIIDKRDLITVDLTFNKLTGEIPTSLTKFDDLQLLLASNAIREIPDKICQMSNWMNGEVGRGCDAILCSPGFFNEFGRRVDSQTTCEPCTYPGASQDYGSTECGPGNADSLDDKSILGELFDAAGGSDWTTSTNWRSGNVCDWFGVTCEQIGGSSSMAVTEISLPGNNLGGIIPSVLFHMKSLRKLDVRNNDVSITFNGIQEAESLEELYLDRTQVTSVVGIGKAPSLRKLHLHKNSFGWTSIPEEIYDLTSLEELNLSDSMLAGTLSANVGNLANLRTLSLVGNQLSGQLPNELGNLGALEELELSNNKWFGTLPSTINGMQNLEALFLDNEGAGSGLSGPLLSFTNMPALREIHLSENQLTGTIPTDLLADVSDLGSVINVYLDGNQLVGTIPAQLTAFRKLNIYLEDNMFSAFGNGVCDQSEWLEGAVGRYGCDGILCPPGHYSPIGRESASSSPCDPCPGAEDSPFLGSTVCLALQKEKEKEILEKLYTATGGENWNNNDGWLDSAFDICHWYGISCRDGSSIESILLGSNRLVGTIPSEVYQLPNLKFLWVYSNPVDISFSGIMQATNLRSLLLDSTKLRSLEGIGNAESLIDLDIRFNHLKGTVPQELDSLMNLQTLTASDNEFTGPVPELPSLRNLNTLRFGSNNLSGMLPSFKDHAELQSIDLSNNDLSGTIPPTFLEGANLFRSVFLDLSGNKLTGTVPGELSRFTDMTIYLRENRIEGINPSLCNLEKWNEGDVGRFQCDGILCPSRTYSPTGRASRSGAECRKCSKNKVFGRSACGKSRSVASPRMGAGTICAAIVGLLLSIGLLV